MNITTELLARRGTILKLAALGFIFLSVSIALAEDQVAKDTTSGPKPASRKPTSTKTKAKTPPVTPAQLRVMIQEKLARNPNYSPGFLISHRDVEPIFNFLLEKGITIAEDHEELYDSILPDNAQLVRLLKTPAGRVFMKKVASDPTAYERLERLSWTPDGRKLIDGFVSSKDGVARFQKLQTGDDVAKISKQLAADTRTPDFQLPTGHIHSANDLLEKLEKVLAAQKPAAE